MHYKLLMEDNGFLGPQHFDEPKTIAISRLALETMPQRDDDKTPPQRKAVMYFIHNGKELELRYQVPKMVLYGMDIEHGSDADKWVGKEVELYKTTCKSFGVVEECVRIRFTASTEEALMKKMKKKKVNPQVYRIK